MDLTKVLVDLRQELVNLEAAILSLERLKAEGRRSGTPSKVLAEIGRLPASSSRRAGPRRKSYNGTDAGRGS
jgi:hypothetical protein